jgi:hypothetical protein
LGGKRTLVIRQKQIDAMYETRFAESVRSYMRLYRTIIPDLIRRFNDEELYDLIHHGIQRAGQYGIVEGKALRLFLALVLIISPKWDEVPNARRFLLNPQLNQEEKLTLLTDVVKEELLQIGKVG